MVLSGWGETLVTSPDSTTLYSGWLGFTSPVWWNDHRCPVFCYSPVEENSYPLNLKKVLLESQNSMIRFCTYWFRKYFNEPTVITLRKVTHQRQRYTQEVSHWGSVSRHTSTRSSCGYPRYRHLPLPFFVLTCLLCRWTQRRNWLWGLVVGPRLVGQFSTERNSVIPVQWCTVWRTTLDGDRPVLEPLP